jgi:hypothetical protein
MDTPFVGPIEAFMTADHARIDRLLEAADAGSSLDLDAFEAFRRGLLTHIAMEERVLLPFASAKLGAPLPAAERMHADHALLARMLASSPTAELCARLREILVVHNPLEEGEDGLYARCDALARGGDADAVVASLCAVPDAA